MPAHLAVLICTARAGANLRRPVTWLDFDQGAAVSEEPDAHLLYYAGQKMQITAEAAQTLMAIFAEAVEADEPRWAVFEASAGGRWQRHMAVVGKGIPIY